MHDEENQFLWFHTEVWLILTKLRTLCLMFDHKWELFLYGRIDEHFWFSSRKCWHMHGICYWRILFLFATVLVDDLGSLQIGRNVWEEEPVSLKLRGYPHRVEYWLLRDCKGQAKDQLKEIRRQGRISIKLASRNRWPFYLRV